MLNNNPVVSVEGLSHNYGGGWAIKDLSLALHENQIVGLLGSNGAGKSTTMNALCGIITPTKGQIKIGQFDMRTDSGNAKRLLGFLPQKAPLYQDLTVDEYLSYAAHLRHVAGREIKRSTSFVKERCGLLAHGKRLIKNLSGGFQQRVGIAQAIIHNPKVVVFDEPTNGLDPIQIKEVRKLIRQISEVSTVLLSSHVLSEVKELCDHIIMVENGAKVFQGSSDEFNNVVPSNSWTITGAYLPHQDAINAIEGLTVISRDTNQTMTIATQDSFDPAGFIKRAVKEEWGLQEIFKNKISLERVFANLSGREN